MGASDGGQAESNGGKTFDHCTHTNLKQIQGGGAASTMCIQAKLCYQLLTDVSDSVRHSQHADGNTFSIE